jgi:hypothetical protein
LKELLLVARESGALSVVGGSVRVVVGAHFDFDFSFCRFELVKVVVVVI